ncbi:GntR family transcriptional regulator [Desmospora profundinema]|uniref:DNA-binding GntR family transcriptional regulator n=1 Tax=Desmospora profundinema TaxID=1571184 RepID=A0ABU1IIJ7_9BACL|nr:GntR family transcriptional regulator [Desmospora profundinema]MDR6224600.1 DNA-binding GntR family transcriptional regulator [Desmospora profundinema]
MPIPHQSIQINRHSAKEQALQLLQRWIIEGTLRPGEKVNDSQLAEALGVSRTPVREALQILELQGFVEMRPGKETRVTPLKKDDVHRLYPPLAALEATAAELAAHTIDEKSLLQLEEMNEKFARALQNRQSYDAMEWDESFHRLIVQSTGNPYLEQFTSVLEKHTRRFKGIFLENSWLPSNPSVEEHRMIIEALRKRDAEQAQKIMKLNWIRPMKRILEQVESMREED